MKKTLIALLALGSVAMAEEVTLTTGISVSKDGQEQIVSALNADCSDWVGGDALTSVNVGSSFQQWSGSQTLASLSFKVTVAELYGAEALQNASSITLNSFSYMGNSSGWCEDAGRTITLTVGGTSVTKELEEIRSGAWLTLSNLDIELTQDAELTITLKPAAGTETATLSLATADIYGTNGASVAWAGVQDETVNSNLNMNGNWSKEAPLVKLSLTTVPEPATATLSLLALAGLAARRRRH